MTAYEFFEQAFVLYEESIPDSRQEVRALQSIMGTLNRWGEGQGQGSCRRQQHAGLGSAGLCQAGGVDHLSNTRGVALVQAQCAVTPYPVAL